MRIVGRELCNVQTMKNPQRFSGLFLRIQYNLVNRVGVGLVGSLYALQGLVCGAVFDLEMVGCIPSFILP